MDAVTETIEITTENVVAIAKATVGLLTIHEDIVFKISIFKLIGDI